MRRKLQILLELTSEADCEQAKASHAGTGGTQQRDGEGI